MNPMIFTDFPLWLMIVVILWSLFWKGLALWKAARLSHKNWFIILFLLNTVGILDIIYIKFVAQKYEVETIEEK